jgi:hypothetical protein
MMDRMDWMDWMDGMNGRLLWRRFILKTEAPAECPRLLKRNALAFRDFQKAPRVHRVSA